MTDRPDWQRFEREANAKLGIQATVTSGSQWYDKNDGTTRGHPLDNGIMLDADEKSTKHRSYSLSVDFLESNRKRSTLAGKIFVLPVRFELDHDSDWIVLSLDDFVSLTGISLANGAKRKSEELDRKAAKAKAILAEAQNRIADMSEDDSLSIHQKAMLYGFIDMIDDALKAFQ